MRGPIAAFLGSALLSGCFGHSRVLVESEPAGAQLVLRGKEIQEAPAEVRLPPVPFARRAVEVSAPGYRTVRVVLRRSSGRVVVVLVPDHGPSGTWTPEKEGL